VIKEQQNRDARVLDLINVLNAAYDFVNAAEPMKKIENRKKTFGQLLKETNECAYFIREYLGDRDFGQCCMWCHMHDKLMVCQLPEP
jgi:hypothetical protein